MDYITTFCGGFIAGIMFMGWAMVELGRTADYMMTDGKMKWIKRTERFKDELEKLKQSRMKDMK